MKEAYPVIITKTNNDYYVFIPDFNISTQGNDLVNSIEMARDAISLMCIDLQDNNKELPIPFSVDYLVEKDEIFTLVDVDLTSYRKRIDNRAVKKNCTIPYWLNEKAEKAGVNFSRVLQEALVKELSNID